MQFAAATAWRRTWPTRANHLMHPLTRFPLPSPFPSLSLIHSFVLRVKLHCAIFKLFHTICPGNLISSTRQYKTQLTQGQRSGGGRERVERERESVSCVGTIGSCVAKPWQLIADSAARESLNDACHQANGLALMAPWRKPKQGQRIYLYYSYPVKG